MSAISTNYRELSPEEVDTVAAECASAWQDPELPMRQYELVVKPELEKFARGEAVLPYDVFVKLMRLLPQRSFNLLDVGAASGYYCKVLELAGIPVAYTGVDFSPHLMQLAKVLWPGIQYKLADAQELPFLDNSFDVVLSSACIMHLRNYGKAIREAARVSKHYVIFHRTPIHNKLTTFFKKEAYGVPCLEARFNEDELLARWSGNGLSLIHQVQMFWSVAEQYGHRSYVLTKEPLAHYPT